MKMACKVHRVRYYNPKPQPINCIALNNSTNQLAFARGDASIEVWDIKNAPYLLKLIPGNENGSVEALGWVNQRLLSTGLGGALQEWDIENLSLKDNVLLTGSAAWCLDVSPDRTLAAVGTEQGFVNLFSVDNNEILYKRLFDKQEGRILCCKFNLTGDLMATGSINTLRVWNVETGQAISRMSVSRRNKEVIVWCLAFLSDNTVVSGDSVGRLTFWDSSIGEQIESFFTHKADVTALAVSENEQQLFCSGMDPVIVNFSKVSQGSYNQGKLPWVKNVPMNIHEHDVRGLITRGEYLISVGVDGYLTISRNHPKFVRRIPPMLPPPRSAVCAEKKLLLLRHSNHLEVWRLGAYAVTNDEIAPTLTNGDVDHKNDKNSNKRVEQNSTDAIFQNASLVDTSKISIQITENPIKLVSVQTKGKSQLLFCALSPTGEYIFYSTDKHIRMLKLDIDDEQTVFVSRLPVSGMQAPCERAAFTSDSCALVTHTPGHLHLMHVDADAGATTLHSLNTDKYFSSKSILQLVVSEKTVSGITYVAAADIHGVVVIYKLHPKKLEHYATLPKYECIPSAISIDSKYECLFIAYVDQMLIEYELPLKRFMEQPWKLMPKLWSERWAAIHSISRHPNRNAIVVQDQNSIWIIEKEYGVESNHEPLPFNIIPIKYLAGFHWLDKDEAVTIEQLPVNILQQLPPSAISSKKKG